MDLTGFDKCAQLLNIKGAALHLLTGMVRAAPDALQGLGASLPREKLRALADNDDEVLDAAIDALFEARKVPGADTDFAVLRQFHYSVQEPHSTFELSSGFLAYLRTCPETRDSAFPIIQATGSRKLRATVRAGLARVLP